MTTKPKVRPPETIDEAINGTENQVVIPSIKKLIKDWADDTQIQFEDGANNNSGELASVAMRLVDYYNNKPFNQTGYLLLCGFLDLPRTAVVEFWDNLIEYLINAKRVQVIPAENSVYSYDSYFFLI